MDLNYVKLNGFKRFEKATLNTSGKIIALLGANEAGKSSILEALQFLNHDSGFSRDINLTRNKEFKDDDIILEASFLLSNEDREAISDIYQSDTVRWFYIKKPVSGQRKFEIKPSLTKDFRYRNQVIKNLEFWTIKDNYAILETATSLIQKSQNFINQLKETIKNKVNLSSSLQNNLKTFPNEIGKIFDSNKELVPDSLLELEESIEKLFEYENTGEPDQKVIEILKERIPKFLLFTEQARNLTSNFNLATLDKQPSNQALLNLLKLADLDINNLAKIINNFTQLESTIKKANKKISEIYKGKWSQSQVKPILNVNASILRVFIENDELDAFEINHRSDGLRQFIALINFLEIEHAQQPILLIDEAELHLHYDAQADLINIFTEQKFASKIIYTTHSVGCLPEDLGTGVKLVLPEDQEERSTIKNHFWVKDHRPGVLPLLFGMGASQLSFMAIRECVFVEGATDMLLLPTLFRQAIQKDYLGFQIVQGVAMTAQANFGLLLNHAPKVAFLVDNDKEGIKYEKQLKKSGIDQTRIFKLPEENKVLEDYIKAELYLEAVNEQIKMWNQNFTEDKLFSLDDIPENNRPQAIKDWCKKYGLKEPEKTNIVYYLLDLATGERQEELIESSFKNSLFELYQQIIKILLEQTRY